MLDPSSGLLTAKDLQKKDVLSFFQFVKKLKAKAVEPLKKVNQWGLLAFFEPSTRTRVSFEAAGLEIGLNWSVLSGPELSLQKGETWRDTFITLAQYRPSVIVVRHSAAGFASLVQYWTGLPVLNAGDGANEHPSQALLDVFTLWEKNPNKKWKIAFFGDVARSRVVRSDLYLMRTFGFEIQLCDDQTLETRLFAKAFGLKLCARKDLPKMDVVYCLRVQKERGSLISQEPLKPSDLGNKTLLMHPGPAILRQDLHADFFDFSAPYSLILNQVENGKWVRMGLLKGILEAR